jgi:hypothetical protein
MKQFIVGIGLGVVICFAGNSSASAYAERADRYFLSEQQLPEIEALGIAPSDDPWALFGAFAKRFSVVSPAEFQRSPRDIRSIAEAGGGDRFALAFVLINLFRLNGIDTELVFLSTRRGSEHGDLYVEQAQVYVPALKQYFDPALPLDSQRDRADRTWLEGRSRLHFSAALQHKGKTIGRCPDLCLHATGVRSGSGGFRDPYAVPIKTIRVPVTLENEGGSPRQ